ncbi:MAG: hypothetical protein RL226_1350 [Bacteroidota bacterium]|jgi:DNA-binding LytR/AlgR family response regulator
MPVISNISCVIVDDEPLASQLLRSYIDRMPGLTCTGEFNDPLQALTSRELKEAELVFLDIQMPGLSGLDLMRLIDPRTAVIFVTAYGEYAVEGFDLAALDYMVKPVSFERFVKSVQRFHARQPVKEVEAEKDSIFVKSGYVHKKILLNELLYLQGYGDYVALHTTEGRTLTLQSLQYFEDSLPQDLFQRIHKSYIVQIKKIDEIGRNRVYVGEKALPVSDTYRGKLEKMLYPRRG